MVALYVFSLFLFFLASDIQSPRAILCLLHQPLHRLLCLVSGLGPDVMTVNTTGPSGATIQENDKPAIDHRPMHKITLSLASYSHQAGPSRATIQESNSLMMEILKLSYKTKPPRLDQPAVPSGATIQENKKPAVGNQPKPIYKISPPPAPLPIEDSQIDQQAGPSAATVHEKNKLAKESCDAGTRAR